MIPGIQQIDPDALITIKMGHMCSSEAHCS